MNMPYLIFENKYDYIYVYHGEKMNLTYMLFISDSGFFYRRNAVLAYI